MEMYPNSRGLVREYGRFFVTDSELNRQVFTKKIARTDGILSDQ